MSAVAENSAPAAKAPSTKALATEVAAVVPGIYIGIRGYEKADATFASWFGCCVGGRAHISEVCISFSCTSSLFSFFFCCCWSLCCLSVSCAVALLQLFQCVCVFVLLCVLFALCSDFLGNGGDVFFFSFFSFWFFSFCLFSSFPFFYTSLPL